MTSPILQWLHKDVSAAEWAFLHRPTPQQAITYPVFATASSVALRVGLSCFASYGLPSKVIAANFDQFSEAGDLVSDGDTDPFEPPAVGIMQFNA